MDGLRILAIPSNQVCSLSYMNQLVEARQFPNAIEPARKLASPPGVGLGWPLVEWCLVAVLAATFVGHTFVPSWRTLKSEFPNYYLAAELYHQGIPLARVYEWTWFQRQNDRLGVRDGLVSFAPNPPTSILALVPFARLQPLAAKRCWLVLSLAFLALSLWILRRVTTLRWRQLILISLLSVLPLSVDFLFARPYVLLLLLICTAYYASCLDHQRTSGAFWAAAAAIKLFPMLSVILFLRKRNWRALAGFMVGAATLVAISVFVFGPEVHLVFFREVLSQASRGDWLGPYVLAQNSFITLWSHLFLIEPELNPLPWINSPTLYAVAFAITVTVIVVTFLISIKSDTAPQARALQWAALIPLLLLLSTTTAPDHSCLLIFTAIVGFDALRSSARPKRAVALLVLYAVACAPLPARISSMFPLSRLAATTAIYALLLWSSGAIRSELPMRRWLTASLLLVSALTLYNLHNVRDRTEDFGRRVVIPRNGYRYANPVPIPEGVAFTEMQPNKYGLVLLNNGEFHDVPMPGDTLSLAGSAASSLVYSELSGPRSFIVRLPAERLGSAPETFTEGYDPALSPNGKWLAFIREEHGKGTAWLSATDSNSASQMVIASPYEPLEVTVTDDGDVIAAAGAVSDPRLVLIRRGASQVEVLSAFPHPARYPSISPDGKRLAFSHRDRGSWHLFVRAFESGYEQQLTHASCNAISPSWGNVRTLLYATDCGRGIGLSAIARVVLPN